MSNVGIDRHQSISTEKVSGAAENRARIERLRSTEAMRPMRNKGNAGGKGKQRTYPRQQIA